MTHTTLLPRRRWLCGALLLAASLLAGAQTDPPAHVAYISAQEGAARIATDGQHALPATLNWPVTTGTRIVLDPGARLELQGGRSSLRLADRADLSITRLNHTTAQVALTDGSASLRMRQPQPGERFEIDTPHLAMVVQQDGEYRVDVDASTDTTRVTVHAGTATVYGEAGQSTVVGARQQLLFGGRNLQMLQRAGVAQRDGFDRWVAARDAREERSTASRYLPRELPGYAQLDAHGEWVQHATYGPVWYPQVSGADWAPYRHGRWAWIEPWGWTWVDDAPWGFAPSHYGRWTQIGPRWAWVPGSFGAQPVYAPALVAFLGGDNWGMSIGSGLPGAAWLPLAPGEYWVPPYHSSERYRRSLNRDRTRPPPDGHHFHRRPHAVTYAPGSRLERGPRDRRPGFSAGSRLPAGVLGGSRITAPPPRVRTPVARPRPDRAERPGRHDDRRTAPPARAAGRDGLGTRPTHRAPRPQSPRDDERLREPQRQRPLSPPRPDAAAPPRSRATPQRPWSSGELGSRPGRLERPADAPARGSGELQRGPRRGPAP